MYRTHLIVYVFYTLMYNTHPFYNTTVGYLFYLVTYMIQFRSKFTNSLVNVIMNIEHVDEKEYLNFQHVFYKKIEKQIQSFY